MKSKYIILLVIFIISLSYFLSRKKIPDNSLNIDLCEDISSDRLKMACYAIYFRNYSYCELSLDFTPYCYESVFPIIDVNKNLCKNLQNDDAKLYCYISLAVKERDATICESMENTKIVDICYTNLFEHVKVIDDIKLCEKIPEQSTKFACMTSLTGDINFCESITEELFEKGFCLAMITNNVSDCFVGMDSGGALSRITFSSCIKHVAIQINNVTMCDMIGRSEDIWKCKMKFYNSIDICDDVKKPWNDFCKLEYIKNNI